jgi:guanine deaminase
MSPFALRGDVCWSKSPGVLETMPDSFLVCMEEAFYCGTAAGGAFFGKAGMGFSGSFEPGYELDALVINDSALAAPGGLPIRSRLERAVYLSDNSHIEAKYVRGRLIV